MNMKLVRPDLLLQLCLVIVVIESQNVFPSITEAQILDEDVTVSCLNTLPLHSSV